MSLVAAVLCHRRRRPLLLLSGCSCLIRRPPQPQLLSLALPIWPFQFRLALRGGGGVKGLLKKAAVAGGTRQHPRGARPGVCPGLCRFTAGPCRLFIFGWEIRSHTEEEPAAAGGEGQKRPFLLLLLLPGECGDLEGQRNRAERECGGRRRRRK